MYLFVIVTYVMNDYITSHLEVPGNFLATAHSIAGAELLYRIGLSSSFISSLCTVFLAMGLYGAIKPVNNTLALFALLFRLIEAALGGMMSIVNFTILKLYLGAGYISAFNANQLMAFINLQSEGYSAAVNIGGIFFSMGSVLFFYLFYKGKYIPVFLSGFGVASSVLITIVCFTKLILPQFAEIADYGWLPMTIAEIMVGIWLLFKGVKVPLPEVESRVSPAP